MPARFVEWAFSLCNPTNTQPNDLLYRMYSRKDIWSIALPILISLFVQNLINITDTAFMGRVGQVELGASALAGVFYLAFYMVIFGFSTGAQILMARRNGERKYQALGPIMGQGTLFLVFFSILLVGASLVWTPRLLDLLISSPAVCKAGEDYMEYRIFGLIFTSIGVMFRAFFVAITRTRVLMVNAIIMTVANVVFNYIFVFGNFGAPQMGIAGAALGSVLAEASAALHFILYTLFRIDRAKYGLSRIRLERAGLIREILNVSVWSMILYFLTIATWFLFFVAVEHLGEQPLAISNIIRSTSTLLFMPVNAFGATACTLVSNAMGAHRTDDVIPIVKRIIKMCYAIVVPLIVLLCIFPEWILRIYTNDSILIESCTASIYVMTIYYMLALPGNLLFQSVSGTGDTRTAFLIEMVTIVFYTLAIYVIIVRNRVDISLCWTVEYIYWGFKLMLSALFFKKANWRNKKI